MSTWHERTKKDISISDDGTEVYIYVDSDDFGAIWVSLPLEDVRSIFTENEKL